MLVSPNKTMLPGRKKKTKQIKVAQQVSTQNYFQAPERGCKGQKVKMRKKCFTFLWYLGEFCE